MAYIYSLETGKLQQSLKTISNTSRSALSNDRKKLAVKNTSGTIVLFSLETGEELCRTPMENREGEQMIFLPDDSGLLDFDWDGRTMLLDCSSAEHRILDGPKRDSRQNLPRTYYIQYDVHSNQIYKFVKDESGNSKGRIMASCADPENISFEVIQECSQMLPNHLKGISFCKTHNYHLDDIKNLLFKTDKNFTELSRIPLPAELGNYLIRHSWISPCEKYMFLDLVEEFDPFDHESYKSAKSLSCLFSLDTMEKVAEFEYDYVSDFVMYDNDTKFVLSTWKGSYLGTI